MDPRYKGGMVQLWSIIQKSDQPTWAFTCDTSAPLLIFLKDENWTTFYIFRSIILIWAFTSDTSLLIKIRSCKIPISRELFGGDLGVQETSLGAVVVILVLSVVLLVTKIVLLMMQIMLMMTKIVLLMMKIVGLVIMTRWEVMLAMMMVSWWW